ncbi:MAG TPA: amidohydrolase family protein [Gemmatimonadales bacterium]|nr:amidohydrolase family protein [Gemmatimonadales bacterium]
MPNQTCFRAAAGVCLAATLAASPGAAQLPQPDLALVHARVVNVTDGSIRSDATVLVRRGRIESLGTGAAPSGVQVIDLAGKYLVPGLIDAHTHLDNLDAARRALETGATTVRSASVGSFRDVALRDLVRGGHVIGPDMVAAGIFVTPEIGEAALADTGLGPLMTGVRTPEQLRALVRVNLRHGVDVIKTRGTERAGTATTDPRQQVYTEAELRAVVEEAAKAGVPVEAHAHGDEGGYAAVKAGVRSIEHGTYLSDSTLALMKEKGTWLVPTFSTLYDLLEPGGDYDNPVTRARAMHMIPRAERTIRRAHELGVKIVTGADADYGPQSITRVSHEVYRLVGLGLTPLEGLQAATINAAELLGLADRTGRIAPGLEADLIAVEENPLENPVTLQDVLLVVSNGRVALNRLQFARR